MSKPRKGSLEMYRRTRYSACQWHEVGFEKNWESLLTANDMSEHIFVRYWRLSSIHRYLVVSSHPRAEPLEWVRSILGSIDVDASLSYSVLHHLEDWLYTAVGREKVLRSIGKHGCLGRTRESLNENSLLNCEMIPSMLEDEDEVTTMSSTYTRR